MHSLLGKYFCEDKTISNFQNDQGNSLILTNQTDNKDQ